MSNEPTRQLEIHEVNWEALSVHAKLGRMVMIPADADLEVKELAEALLGDRADELKAWLAAGTAIQPTPDVIEYWDARRWSIFTFSIVQPFVVAKLQEEILDGTAQKEA